MSIFTADERQALIKQQVARLQTDPFSTEGEDKEFRNYVGGAYRHVYGSNDERRQAGLHDDATPLRAKTGSESNYVNIT